MSANIDAGSMAKITFREPPLNSCITKEVLDMLASLIVVEIPASADDVDMQVSKAVNNLASIDADGGILVPAAEVYAAQETWAVSPGNPIEFEMPAGFDATTGHLSFWAVFASNETGTPVRGETNNDASTDDNTIKHIWPSVDVKSVAAAKVILTIKNATQDATLYLRLLKIPTPPQQA